MNRQSAIPKFRFGWVMALAAALPIIPSTQTFAGNGYEFIDLGSLTNRSSHGLAINDLSHVVGMSTISGTPGGPGTPAEPFIPHAFLWRDGTMIDLGAFPSAGGCSPLGCESRALGITDSGLVCGWSGGPYQKAFVWSEQPTGPLQAGLNQLPMQLPENANVVAQAMNDSLQVVGEFRGQTFLRTPVRWHHDGSSWIVTNLGTLRADGDGFGGAYDINQAGQSVGQASNEAFNLSAFLHLPAPAHGLPAGMNEITPGPPTGSALALAINDHTQIVGVYGLAQGWIWLPQPAYGFPAGVSLLPLLDGQFFVRPSDLNNQGVIVGTAFIPQGQGFDYKGVMFDPDAGQWIRLNDLLPPGVDWNIRNFSLEASINDRGEITGDAVSASMLDVNGFPATHAYLLRPVIATIPGDVNGDGAVNINDLLLVINAWGVCPNCELIACPADLTRDCQVNVSDLLEVINGWTGN